MVTFCGLFLLILFFATNLHEKINLNIRADEAYNQDLFVVTLYLSHMLLLLIELCRRNFKYRKP